MSWRNEPLKSVWVIAVHWDPESSSAKNENGAKKPLQSNSLSRECIGELTRIVGYLDLQATLLLFFPALALSPLFGLATAFEMAPLVTRVAVLATCREGLLMHTVAMVSAELMLELGPWVPRQLFG